MESSTQAVFTLRQRRACQGLIALSIIYAAVLVCGGFVSLSPYRQFATVPELYRQVRLQRAATNDVVRDDQCIPHSGLARQIAYTLPPEARVFVGDMLGSNNIHRTASFYFLNYYLMPRTVDTSLGKPARFMFYFDGQSPASTSALIRAGYDILITPGAPGGTILQQPLRPLERPAPDDRRLLARHPRDAILALVLPLLTAVLGAVVCRRLLPALYAHLSWGERGAYALALGYLMTGQIFLAVRLLGGDIGPAMFWGLLILTAVCATRLVGRNPQHHARVLGRAALIPSAFALLPLAALFIPIFWLAGLEGLREFDAVMAWAVKAKLLYLFQGRELVSRFSDPALGYAHLDYPMLLPSLTAFTYSVIGQVNEFVSKFWPAWMLLMLCVGVLTATGFPRRQPLFSIAIASTVAFLPFSLRYVRMEGGTLPMLFFATLATMQLGLGVFEQRRDRITLGGLMLLGAGMCKLEGLMLAAAWGSVLLVLPATRRLLRPDREMARAMVLGLVLIAPYVALRALTPPLHPQSHWPAQLLAAPRDILPAIPNVFGAFMAGQWLNEALLRWYSPDSLSLVWNGHWVGMRSLIDLPTAGHAWVCLILAAILLRAFPSARPAVLLMSLVPVIFTLALSLVIAATPAFESRMPLVNALAFSSEEGCGRYLSPIFVAWGIGMSLLAAHLCGLGTVPAPLTLFAPVSRRLRAVVAKSPAGCAAALLALVLIGMLAMTRHYALGTAIPPNVLDALIEVLQQEAWSPPGGKAPLTFAPVKSVEAKKVPNGYLLRVERGAIPAHPEVDVRTRYFHVIAAERDDHPAWRFERQRTGLAYYTRWW